MSTKSYNAGFAVHNAAVVSGKTIARGATVVGRVVRDFSFGIAGKKLATTTMAVRTPSKKR